MRKRSKYRPKGVRLDPITYVLAGVQAFSRVPQGTDLRIKNHYALNQLRLGQATKPDIDVLIGALNMTEALARMRLGDDWQEEILAGLDALHAVAQRGKTTSRFVCKGPELTAINLSMEIHDAQLDACTVKDIEMGMDLVAKEFRAKKMRAI